MKKVLLDNMKKIPFFTIFWLITKHKISSSKTSQTNMMNLDSIKEYFPFIFYISNLSLAGTKKRFIWKTRKSIYPIIFFIFILKSFSSFYSRKPSNFCILDLYQQLFSKRKFIHFEWLLYNGRWKAEWMFQSN